MGVPAGSSAPAGRLVWTPTRVGVGGGLFAGETWAGETGLCVSLRLSCAIASFLRLSVVLRRVRLAGDELVGPTRRPGTFRHY